MNSSLPPHESPYEPPHESPHGQDRPVVGMYSFRTRDPHRLASFWAELMRLPLTVAGDDLVMLDFDHEVSPTTWMFERATDVTAGATGVALDLGAGAAGSWSEVADRARALGAEQVAQRHQDGIRWVEMRDPDGNRFRVFAPRPERIG